MKSFDMPEWFWEDLRELPSSKLSQTLLYLYFLGLSFSLRFLNLRLTLQNPYDIGSLNG